MRWQIALAQLSQPVLSKEGARAHQRLLDELLAQTRSREELELQQESARELFEQAMGFPFIRGAKG